jgi:hypothetical protein
MNNKKIKIKKKRVQCKSTQRQGVKTAQSHPEETLTSSAEL